MTLALQAMLRTPGVVGMLGREINVRVIDISASGCLLECSTAVPAGTLATLSVQIDGGEYLDHVRIARCQRLSGAGSTHHVGAEFLWLSLPASGSLRCLAGEFGSRGGGVEGLELKASF